MNVWGLLGIAVAMAAGFCLLLTGVVQDKSFYEQFRWHLCAALIVVGAVVGLLGRILSAPLSADETEEAGAPSPPFPLFRMVFWGPMLMLFGVIIIFIAPKRSASRELVAAARATNEAKATPPVTNKTAVATQAVAATQAVVATQRVVAVPNVATQAVATQTVAKPLPSRPSFKLQGLSYRQTNPSVLINGRTYFVGDYVGEAKLTAIQEHSATLEWNGQTILLVAPE